MSAQAVGFPAFGPLGRGSGTKGGGAVRRGTSWWARAWVRAMEDSALDPAPLKRGRAYARTGRVGSITVSPGALHASVQDDNGEMYHTSVALEPLSDDAWERFVGALASRAGRLAALLDGEMPRDVVAAAVDADVQLLPGIGDLDPACDCPTWDLPCVHAAALSYQAAWLLDADPFVLFLLRGRGRDELLVELRSRSAVGGAGTPAEGEPSGDGEGAPSGTGVLTQDAREVFARPHGDLPPPPEIPGPPRADELLPGVPSALADGTPVDVPLLREVLARAAADAAAFLRAHPPTL